MRAITLFMTGLAGLAGAPAWADPTVKAHANCGGSYDTQVGTTIAHAFCVDQNPDLVIDAEGVGQAVAHAELGILKVRADAFYHLDKHGVPVFTSGRPTASFEDQITITPSNPALAGMTGWATATFHLDGSAPSGTGIYLFGKVGGAFDGGKVIDTIPTYEIVIPDSGSHSVDQDLKLRMSFTYGVAFNFGLSLDVIIGDSGTADFSNTFKLTGLATTDFFGNAIPGASFTGSAGTDWLAIAQANAAAVPEPGTLSFLALGLAGLLAASRRKSQR